MTRSNRESIARNKRNHADSIAGSRTHPKPWPIMRRVRNVTTRRIGRVIITRRKRHGNDKKPMVYPGSIGLWANSAWLDRARVGRRRCVRPMPGLPWMSLMPASAASVDQPLRTPRLVSLCNAEDRIRAGFGGVAVQFRSRSYRRLSGSGHTPVRASGLSTTVAVWPFPVSVVSVTPGHKQHRGR